MDEFYVGDLKGSEEGKYAAFEKELRTIKGQMQREGLFDASPLYTFYKFTSTVAFAALAVWLVLNYDSFAVHMVAAVSLAFFFQQCGWLAHDYLHHQVFHWRFANDLVGCLVGNVFQGFSVSWWKNKHNTHHSIPNLHESTEGAHDGDPDIDTMPLLAWSKYFLKQAPPNAWYLKYQSILFLPLLCFARLAWMQQSFTFVFRLNQGWGKGAFDGKLGLGALEHIGLIAHYVWYTALLFCMPLTHALAFAAVSESLGGLLIGIAFGVGHNGMALYDHKNPPPFGVLQITTTRNVHDNGFTGWFMGGLHYQIEHHLFPTMPRSSLAEAARRVKALCKKHDIPYHATGLIEGNLEVMKALDDVVEGLESFPAM